MNTVRFQIMLALGEALAAVGATVYQHLDVPLGDAQLPALVYGWAGDEVEEYGRQDKHTLSVILQAHTRGADADATCDALIAEAYRIVMENKSFGGLVKGIRVGSARRESAAEGGKGVVQTQVLHFNYQTQTGSLTAAG